MVSLLRLVYSPFTYVLNDITVTAYILPYIGVDAGCNTSISTDKPVSHGSPLLLCCHPADIHFPSNLFLPSCHVGVVCPCARSGNIINMSAILYQLAQSFLKRLHHISKMFFIMFFWCCLNCRLHRPTLSPWFTVVLLRFVQRTQVSDVEHKWALTRFSLNLLFVCWLGVDPMPRFIWVHSFSRLFQRVRPLVDAHCATSLKLSSKQLVIPAASWHSPAPQLSARPPVATVTPGNFPQLSLKWSSVWYCASKNICFSQNSSQPFHCKYKT